MRLNQWVEDVYQMDGWWTCIQVDTAVLYFGGWIEHKLLERDEQGKAIYSLEDLLRETVVMGDAAFWELVEYNDELE
jgi:hypothetical protein